MDVDEQGASNGDGLKEDPDLRDIITPTWEYCAEDRHECLAHLQWDKLWSVELVRNEFVLGRRIQLVKAEIKAVERRMSERADQEQNVNNRINAILNQSMVQPVTLSMSGNGSTASKPPGTVVHARHTPGTRGLGFGQTDAKQKSVYQNLSNVAWSHARYKDMLG